jgi:hypothetical protein
MDEMLNVGLRPQYLGHARHEEYERKDDDDPHCNVNDFAGRDHRCLRSASLIEPLCGHGYRTPFDHRWRFQVGTTLRMSYVPPAPIGIMAVARQLHPFGRPLADPYPVDWNSKAKRPAGISGCSPRTMVHPEPRRSGSVAWNGGAGGLHLLSWQ